MLNGILIIPKWIVCDSVKYVIDKYSKKIESAPEDELITIVPEIDGEILQCLPLISSNELRDFYVELLFKASIKSKVDAVHPRFIQLLKGISTDEILIINYLIKNPLMEFLELIPQFRLKINGARKFGPSAIWVQPEILNKLTTPSNVYLYIINLVKLGVLDEVKGSYNPKQEDLYKRLEDRIIKGIGEGKYESYKEDCSFDNIKFLRGFYAVNQFGNLFLKSLS